MNARELLGRGTTWLVDSARAARPSTRDAERAFRAGLEFRRSSEGWSDDRRRAWILERLREVLRAAARDVPFYRDRFRAAGFDPSRDFSFGDFAAVPPLEREEVHAHLDAMVSPLVPVRARRLDGTGGSTGVPLRYYSGPRERGWRLSGQEHVMRMLGVPRGVATAFLWGHHIDARERAEWKERVRDHLTNRRWFDCFRLDPDTLLGYHAELAAQRPACLVAYASALDSLAQVLWDRQLRASYPTRRIVTGGEKLWPHQRERVTRVFRAPVHERYGSREVGLIAAQRSPEHSLHLDVDWPNLLVEPAESGETSDILVTKLQADAMPMVRYRIGDVGRFPAGSAPGYPALRLEEVLGRILDRLYAADGRWLHGIGIAHLMKDFPLREFQIRQRADRAIDVLVIPGRAFAADHGRRIVEVLRANLPGVPIVLREVEAIERSASNKWRPVLSEARPDASPAVATP